MDKPQLKIVDKEKGEEYIVNIPPSLSQQYGVMTRQRIRAAERDMTYINHGAQRICEFVLISKRTKSKRKRALKRKERENAQRAN